MVCNVFVPPYVLHAGIGGPTRTLINNGTQVELSGGSASLDTPGICNSGLGDTTSLEDATVMPVYPTGTGGGSFYPNELSENTATVHDVPEGWWTGTISMTRPPSYVPLPTYLAGWNNGVDGQRPWTSVTIGGQVQYVWINWVDRLADGSGVLGVPTLPPQATTAGVDAYQGPAYCDITTVLGDVSETVPKEPSQTYRYEIAFAGRNGMTPAPDKIGFSAGWQENNQDSNVPYANITTLSEDAVQVEGDTWAGIAMWSTPPLLSPLVINVVFPERKVYAIRLACLSDDDQLSYWVAGDLEPDPHSEAIAEDLAYQRLQECVPDGWSVLNPKTYAHTSGCVMLWLFKPRTLGDQWETLEENADGTILQAGIGIGSDIWGVPGTFNAAAGAGTCAGLTVNVAPGPLGSAGEIQPISACSGTAQDWANFVKTALRLGIVLGGGIFLVNMLMSIWGGPKINNESVDDNGQGRMVL